MVTHTHEPHITRSVFAGLLLGGLAGAITTLLMAPQSGRQTRAQIKQVSVDLRDHAFDTIDHAVESVNFRFHEITDGIHAKAEEIEQSGREFLVKQLDHVSSAAQAGKMKMAVKSADVYTRS